MIIATYLNRNRTYKHTGNDVLIPYRNPMQWQNTIFFLKIFLNLSKIKTFEYHWLDVSHHQIQPFYIMMRKSVLVIFIAENAFSTVVVTISKSNTNTMGR